MISSTTARDVRHIDIGAADRRCCSTAAPGSALKTARAKANRSRMSCPQIAATVDLLGMTVTSIGIDFGTTNCSLARASDSGEVELAQFSHFGGLTPSYRSLLYLEQVKEHGRNLLRSWSGPEGIERYLASDHTGRLIQSLKSFLSNQELPWHRCFRAKTHD